MTRFAASDGCTIHYDVEGDGAPLLLISGLGGSANFWRDIVPELTSSYRVVTFDHRGTGRSDRPDGGYSIGRIAEDATQLMSALEIDTFRVVGHSTGGLIAQYLALDLKQRIERLVISGSWGRRDTQFRAMFEARLAILLQSGSKPYQLLTHALGFPSDYLETNRDTLADAIENAETALSPIAVAAARIQMLLNEDRCEELAGITCPTLVIGASDDPLILFHHARYLADVIPQAELLSMEGSHFFPRVHPIEFAQSIKKFLGGKHV